MNNNYKIEYFQCPGCNRIKEKREFAYLGDGVYGCSCGNKYVSYCYTK